MWKNFAVFLVSLTTSLFLADLILHRHSLGPAYLQSWRDWAPYDTRDRLRFILDERKAGRDVVPASSAKLFIESPVVVRGERIVPLGGVAGSVAVGGSEGGFHSAFSLDEAGFNNPRGTWPLPRSPHVFLVGDSFTYGDAVRQGEDVGSRLRERVSHVVNLGARGNGPLQQLAGIREYVAAGRVAYVFWMFYERNDLIDLNDGKADPILRRYLQEGFMQDLQARQEEVNAAVRVCIEERVRKEIARRPGLLPSLRAKVKEALPRQAGKEAKADGGQREKAGDDGADIPLFREIIGAAKREVETKGGRLVFVYLPSYRRFSGEALDPWANHKDAIIGAVEAVGAPIVDIEPHFRQTKDPLALFPFRLNGHYNDAGYALVARVLAEFMRGGRS